MKRTKIVWLLALMVWAAAEVQAQEPAREKEGEKRRPTPTEMAEHRTEKMARALNLSPEQRARVAKINQEQAQRTADYHRARQADREQIKQILTPEQLAQWEQMCAKHPGRGHRPHPDRMAPCRGWDGPDTGAMRPGDRPEKHPGKRGPERGEKCDKKRKR